MKYLLTILSMCCCLIAFAQHPNPLAPERFDANDDLAPFYHGVASGDPLTDRVIIWTRVSVDTSELDVYWQVALDTGMTQIVREGSFATDANRDYTVKVDVTGLSPDTYYYYEFNALGKNSIRGRTKTTPVGAVDSLRFAVVSCSNVEAGYFNAYARIAERNDIDAVLHLGDYIYEYGNGEYGTTRNAEPEHEILTLGDYRMRHSHYKLDSDLRAIHQQYPFIVIWDDHETANNSWFGGAGNHNADEGDWFDRKTAGVQAYFEWLPIRKPNPNDDQRIYRKISYGNLLDLHLLDTRLEGRDEQDGVNNTSQDRTLLGQEQYDWLVDGMQSSNAQWQIVGQQVMMAPLKIAGIPVNSDQWDGYPAERSRLLNDVIFRGIQNFVVLTGDIHTSWGNDIPWQNYNADTGSGSAGVEFVTTSVTSPGFPFSVEDFVLQTSNPHMKYIDLTEHGYLILDINQSRTQGEWFYVPTVDEPATGENFAGAWYTNNGTRHLQQATTPSAASFNYNVLQAPALPRPVEDTMTAVTILDDVTVVGVYPNPFYNRFIVQYDLKEQTNLNLTLLDMSGKVIYEKNLGMQVAGVHHTPVFLSENGKGNYILLMQSDKGLYKKMIVKM